MGTRNLTCVVIDGEYKIAKYGQWDGYPSGQGATALAFLHNYDKEKFKQQVREIRDVPLDELVALGDRWLKVYPHMTRDLGAKFLQVVHDGVTTVNNDLNFAADGLFCEYCYVIDLDKNTFEIFEGFNKSPLADGERFKFLTEKQDGKYSPVKHVRTYSLDDLPTEEQFISDLEPKEDEE